jgi:filamentous hemagglutinin
VVVQDGSGQTSTPPQSFSGTISPAPAVNTFSFTAVPSVANQNTVNLTLSSALLVNLTGKLCLTFSADPSVVGSYQGQEVVYANGTKDSACSSTLNRTLGFTIAAGSTTPVWDGGDSSQFSQGTVAGTITVTLQSLVDANGNSVLPSAAPSQKIAISVGAPTLIGSPTMTASSSSVTVVFNAVTPKRSVTGATYVFNSSSSQPITASVSFTSGSFAAMDQSQWFGTPASLATGGSFSLSATFSCTNCSALTGVQVTLSN